MKKILVFVLCAASTAGVFAQKQAVADAKKLSGKIDKIEEARALIKGAMENPETSNDAMTYFVAGNIEWDAYDKGRALSMVNPDEVDGLAMAEQLLNGYNYYMRALPLDSLPNEKGQVKPKYSKDIASKLSAHANDFYTAGANFFNNQKAYPEAYLAFVTFANLPSMPLFEKNSPIIDQPTLATAYFNAGLGAYSGNEVDLAAEAFRNARLNNYDQPECYIYELACWQNIAQKNPEREKEAQEHIYDIALMGNDKFGFEQPLFLNNLVNCLVSQGKTNDALTIVNEQISENPDKAGLYALRAYTMKNLNDLKSAEADYRKAASFADADAETLKNASYYMLRQGQEIWNAIDSTAADAKAQRESVRDNYWLWAKDVAKRGLQKNAGDSDLNSIVDNIDYFLETYTF
ncbi:MAG: hypothetical protein HDS82_04455 [Bacteroidales bacterium]|nr:hypothetical protein [Bacteroidales bacterium]